MNRNFDNKITDIKKAEEERRAELTMMYIYMDRYPEKAREKMRKLPRAISGSINRKDDRCR